MKSLYPTLIFIGVMLAVTQLSTLFRSRPTKQSPVVVSERGLGRPYAFPFKFGGFFGTNPPPPLPAPQKHGVQTGFKDLASVQNEWALASIGIVNLPKLKCDKTITVAVIDTGLDYTHPAFANSLWTNPGESGLDVKGHDKRNNQIDDDANGFVDDVIGWNFVHNTATPYDTHGHGTHVAGLIAATASAQDCNRARIMPLTYYGQSGLGLSLDNTIKAIQYAVKNGAQIINYSDGGSAPSDAEKQAIEEAAKSGILFITSAGNNGQNIEHDAFFPASYALENLIAVSSTNKEGHLLPSSNFGTMIDLAAPGLGVFSTLPEGKYRTMSGTSQAAAIVSGAAALLLSQTRLGHGAVLAALKAGHVTLHGNQKKLLVHGGIINLPAALKQLNGK